METFLRLIVLILVTFLVIIKFVDPAIVNEAASEDYGTYPEEASEAEGTDDQDALHAMYAVAGVVGIAVVALICLYLYRTYQKRKVYQEDSTVLMENGKKWRGKQASGTNQGTSCELVAEKEADNRVTFKKKYLKAGKHVKRVRESGNSQKPVEGTRLLSNITLASCWNRVLDLSNKRNDQEVVGKYGSASVPSYKEPKAGVHTKGQETFDRNRVQKGREHRLSQSRDTFDGKYETLNAIGEGCFGFVKLAQRRSDFEQVVVKFIIKSKISSWTLNNKNGRIPLEVEILSRLHHPNIVKVIDVFEDNEFVQMVMEKHGSGMDLFEFIDRKPRLDEALASLIFRQAVDAVSYIHSVHVVHRDIKAENIIIDERFRIKLIDFGAAAYYGKGKRFATFCGTFEYCSPEVVQGNMYEGPEQDMWALGVTLYGLMFGAHPFLDREDIIDCEWNQPFAVTRSLRYLLTSLFTPDPKSRAKISDLEHNNWVNQDVDVNNYRWCDVVPR